MDYRKIMIDDLGKHRQRVCGLKNLREKIIAAESELRAIKGADPSKITVAGGGNAEADKRIALIVERDNYKRNYAIIKRAVDVLDEGLRTLTEQERKTLELFYMDRPHDHVGKVCELWQCEQAEAYRRKDEALRKLTIACYGITEL